MKNTNELKKILGMRIREERKKKGWTIEKLAELIGLSPASLGLVERADRALSLQKLYSLSKILNVTIDSLMNLENHQCEFRAEKLTHYTKELDDDDFSYILDLVKLSSNHLQQKPPSQF